MESGGLQMMLRVSGRPKPRESNPFDEELVPAAAPPMMGLQPAYHEHAFAWLLLQSAFAKRRPAIHSRPSLPGGRNLTIAPTMPALAKDADIAVKTVLKKNCKVCPASSS